MSLRYKGGVISATPPTTSTSSASGSWTLQQQLQAIAAGLWPVNGPFYIEDVFSTYLYTGNDSVQTITNGIDLAGKGGLIWLKKRNNTSIHGLWDTARGGTKRLRTEDTGGESTLTDSFTFNSNGFTIPAGGSSYLNESSSNTYASWTFREQPKFFDVVTYTGNGTTQTISHSLGSVPGFIIVKRTNSAEDWWCFHRYDFTYRFKLNATNAAVNTTSVKYLGNNVIDVAPTSTTFTVGDTGGLNGSGDSFVAYLFAHDAGGFGLTGTDNVISCGSFTTDSGGAASVTLGYEPQWILYKTSSATGNWAIVDNMRGITTNASTNTQRLKPNLSDAEDANTGPALTATGFNMQGGPASGTVIYIAIRRGPMKTPTTGTSVFNAVTYTGNQTARNITGYGFPLDLVLGGRRNDTNNFKDYWFDRLRGATKAIDTNVSGGTAAEYTDAQVQTSFALQDGTSVGTDSTWNATGINIVLWGLRRAPGFFDVVCVTGGSGTVNTATHNLGVVPELVIQKYRGLADDWYVFTNQVTGFLNLNSTSARIGTTNYMTTTTSTVVNTSLVSNPANNPVIYLFATVAGVSKVSSYTGTGTTKQIDCGFTGGARFVLIKRTDSTGDWYVWDSARGIVAGNDPYLLLNSTAAEVTNTDYVDTYSAGFEISSTAPAAINANGGTFIFLAIA